MSTVFLGGQLSFNYSVELAISLFVLMFHKKDFRKPEYLTSRMFLYLVEAALIFSVSISEPIRHLDPVVITGADVPAFLGCVECIYGLVAFAWRDGSWTQAPLQVSHAFSKCYEIVCTCRLTNGIFKTTTI